jgi:hypothetical protein
MTSNANRKVAIQSNFDLLRHSDELVPVAVFPTASPSATGRELTGVLTGAVVFLGVLATGVLVS